MLCYRPTNSPGTRLMPTASPLCAALAALVLGAVPVVGRAGSLDGPAGETTVLVPVAPGAPVVRNGVQVELGFGAASAPGYFGSDELIVGPTGTFRLNGLTLGGTTFVDPNGDPYGLGLRGSFRYIGERTAADYPELDGLADIDASLELGLGVGYTQPGYEVFADVRYGVVGHESFVGEVGADVFLRPTDRLTFSAGPRVFFGDDDYAGTYFGVTPDEAAQSSFGQYDARGGILAGGIELGAEYDITDAWGVEGTIRYDRFLGDAADSPIVLGGSDNAVSASIMATRTFTLDF